MCKEPSNSYLGILGILSVWQWMPFTKIHPTVTWKPWKKSSGHHQAVIRWSSDCPSSDRLSSDRHLTVLWLSSDRHLTVIWPSSDRHRIIIWPSVIWQSSDRLSSDCHLTVIWLSSDRHLTVIFLIVFKAFYKKPLISWVEKWMKTFFVFRQYDVGGRLLAISSIMVVRSMCRKGLFSWRCSFNNNKIKLSFMTSIACLMLVSV